MIDNFEQRGVRDGSVSREEFEDYYGSLGACECSCTGAPCIPLTSSPPALRRY